MMWAGRQALEILLVVYGALAWNNTLEHVGYVRQTRATLAPIDATTNVGEYECRLGVPYLDGAGQEAVGHEAWFYDAAEQTWRGPMLVTDVEDAAHARLREAGMQLNGLGADVDCDWLVHHRGWIVVVDR